MAEGLSKLEGMIKTSMNHRQLGGKNLPGGGDYGSSQIDAGLSG